MKSCFLTLSFILLQISLFAQKVKPDSTYNLTKIGDNRYIYRLKGLWGMSYVEEITFEKDGKHYVKNGFYTQYYDSNFTKVKRQGYYYDDNETGFWQEFNSTGLLKFEGMCKVILYKYLDSANNLKILKIDSENPIDTTVYLCNDIKGLDSFFNTTVKYRDTLLFEHHSPKSAGHVAYVQAQSLKVGEWRYYDKGKLNRKEYYKEGILIKTITY